MRVDSSRSANLHRCRQRMPVICPRCRQCYTWRRCPQRQRRGIRERRTLSRTTAAAGIEGLPRASDILDNRFTPAK